MGTFIIFGNSERVFLRMASSIIDCIGIMPKPIIIQAGICCELFKDISSDIRVFDTCSPKEFQLLCKNSSVIISHCGYGSIKESLLIGRIPAVFVRSANNGEHIDGHQEELASDLPSGSVVFVSNTSDLKKYLNSRNHQQNPLNEDFLKYFNDENLKKFLYFFIKKILKI